MATSKLPTGASPADVSDPQIAEAELRRLNSEAARNEAEREKLNLEALEAKLRLGQKWYKGRILIQLVVGGVVAAALLASWVIGYLQPILKSEQELARITNEILKNENELARQELKHQTTAFGLENEKFREELASLAEQNDALQKQQERSSERSADLQAKLQGVSQLYSQLSKTQQLTSLQRNSYARIAKQSQDEKDSLEANLDELQQALLQTVARGERINSQLAIRGSKIRVIHNQDGTGDAREDR